MKYTCVQAHELEYDVRMMCRVLSVSRAGYYRWRKHGPSARAREDAEITQEIQFIHVDSRATYGAPRMHAQLRLNGRAVSKCRVARLMRSAGIVVRIRRKFRVTTNSAHAHPVAENVLDRKFSPQTIGGPGKVFAGDITYIPTDEGWLYLAVVLDLFSRRVVGWSMHSTMSTELVINALRMALTRGMTTTDMLYHTDRGSQYAAQASRQLLRESGIRASMSRKGNCYDNAVVESWNATLKTELINRRRWLTREEARSAIFEFIETWYNRRRLHSTLGYMTPEAFEKAALRKAA